MKTTGTTPSARISSGKDKTDAYLNCLKARRVITAHVFSFTKHLILKLETKLNIETVRTANTVHIALFPSTFSPERAMKK